MQTGDEPMADEPQNLILELLREIRAEQLNTRADITRIDAKIERMDAELDRAAARADDVSRSSTSTRFSDSSAIGPSLQSR
jgi:hypothetical protein